MIKVSVAHPGNEGFVDYAKGNHLTPVNISTDDGYLGERIALFSQVLADCECRRHQSEQDEMLARHCM